jgi:type I restriction enzyme S subunit
MDVYHRDFITADINFMQATATPGEIQKFALQRGDVLIMKDSESWTDIAYTHTSLMKCLGCCAYHLAQYARIKESLMVSTSSEHFRPTQYLISFACLPMV